MSDFFDNLGKAVRKVADNVSTEVSAAAQEQRLKEAYQALGRMHYEAAQAGNTAAGAEFDAQMAKINDLITSIREIRQAQNVADV